MATLLTTCLQRSQQRDNQRVPERTIRGQHRRLRNVARSLRKEGIRRVYVLDTPEQADESTVTRARSHLDLRSNHGPFDIIGDIHGCYDELTILLDKLGYQNRDGTFAHPEGRQAIFLGDLVDRGPASDKVLELAMTMTNAGAALCIAGNHENKLLRCLKGNPVQVSHGLQDTLDQLQARTPEFRQEVQDFIQRLTEQYILDDGRLAVAHAGILERYQGRVSRRVKDFCLYGQTTTGETDEWGLPVRQEWALDYKGKAVVVYGHTPVETPWWTNETINVDTGCVFGGKLTALRYPEREVVSVPAARTYYEPARPAATPTTPQELPSPETSSQQSDPNALDLAEFSGDIHVRTSRGTIRIPEARSSAALEAMSRHAIDPRWLIYLPPTISPTRSSDLPGTLEHPDQAFAFYQDAGLNAVICEEKHMGSRGIIVVAKSQKSAKQRFGIDDPNAGACYSRTGRRFFFDPDLEARFLHRTRDAVGSAGLWDTLDTDWLLLDCEIMPWSLKAQGLLRNTYAPTGAAAVNTMTRIQDLLSTASQRGLDTSELADSVSKRLSAAQAYRAAYRQYCWDTNALENIKVAPFHIMAAENQLLTTHDHRWHMQQAHSLQEQDPDLFQRTRHRVVDLANPAEEAAATAWWTELTSNGGEGMVVKPLDFIPNGNKDKVQPAVKIRGPEYLRIIYGPEYNLPGNIERMKRRSLGRKQALAILEFNLGLEGLQRFIDREPLRRVHECAFAIMALASEPVDPRL